MCTFRFCPLSTTYVVQGKAMFLVVCGILLTGIPYFMMHWDRYQGGNPAGQESPEKEQTRRTAQEEGFTHTTGQGWLGIPLPLLRKVRFSPPLPPPTADRWNRWVCLVILIMGCLILRKFI